VLSHQCKQFFEINIRRHAGELAKAPSEASIPSLMISAISTAAAPAASDFSRRATVVLAAA
jgi:hypothetical protein